SDYRYENFHIHHWDVFRPCPQGFFNTIPYEVVLGRRRAGSPRYEPCHQDGLGWLMQVGLDRDLAPFSRGLVAGTLEPAQGDLLATYNDFFSATKDADRRAVLGKLAALDASAIAPFVGALFALVQKDFATCRQSLELAVQRGLSGFARVRAEVL